jgi:hydrogenase maturation protein HypF
MRERRHITVEGIVQGVGFRPFVYGLARRRELAGYVNNDARGVTIEVEGEPETLEDFLYILREQPPPLAQIERVVWQPVALHGESTFVIESSHSDAEKHAFISPDVCVCDDCLREMNDPRDRRYRYPFINCTNCGPRFTIIKDVPYDRPFTTMAAFPMCADCAREYSDPADRRFHAQPNACPACGPHVALENWEEHAAIERAARLLKAGKIVAIKGMGGYHLACDAMNESAVQQLRTRKHRFDKPFALMVADVESARALCEIDEVEAELLASRQRPIVLLRERKPRQVADQVAPKEKNLGLLLPYTPLHFLLLDAFGVLGKEQPAVLVMTSGNQSDEPIAYLDEEARERLAHIADAFLTHDREIYMRCDDSVARVVKNCEVLIRRSRGYAPQPIRAPLEYRMPILAVGAHLKNTFCLGKNHHAFLSHHIGDLENVETLRSFTEGIEHFQRLFDVQPQVVAHDLHPEYLATKYAMEIASSQSWPSIGVQHHHAHIAAVTGEHGVSTPVIGAAFDGTGYGADGTLWGGEFLVCDWKNFERIAHLQTLPLAGGEAAIHQVWRLAAAWLHQTFGDEFTALEIDFVERLNRAAWQVLRQMLDKKMNCPRSSAMGRYFDAVAALLGVRDVVNYEAQAAIELEMLADGKCVAEYPFALESDGVLRLDETLRGIVDDLRRGEKSGVIAAKFHNTIAALTAHVCEQIRSERNLEKVALGGGVFQNALLLQRTLDALQARGFEVLTPTQLPFNDGAISFGQAVVAGAQLAVGEGVLSA